MTGSSLNGSGNGMARRRNVLFTFLAYQAERFPLAVLVPTTLSVVLSSYVIASTLTVVTQAPLKILLGVVAALAYLFHMRAVDEGRDFDHDTRHHRVRPIQRGLVSRKELDAIDRVGLALFVGIALGYGLRTAVLGSVALLYSFVAGREFFLGERIRRRFFAYNAVNLIQAILLQAVIYSIFTGVWYRFPTLWLHLAFVLSNSILIEFVRKIKIQAEESSGHDTYSWHLGFRNSLWVYGALIAVSYSLFLSIMNDLGRMRYLAMIISAIPVVLLLAAIVRHGAQQDKSSEEALQLSTLALYVGLHLVIVLSLKV